MGRKRFAAFRTKKTPAGGAGVTPLYSKEDIREQYCITNKQLHVLETAQARKLFGCIPNQDWKSCRRASLLSSCLRKTKSASDENLAAGNHRDTVPLAWEPLPPEMQGPSVRAVAGQQQQQLPAAHSSTLHDIDAAAVADHLQQQRQLASGQQNRSLRQSFDEELANAVMRRKTRASTDVTEDSIDDGVCKRHTWADEETITKPRSESMPTGHVVPASCSDGNLMGALRQATVAATSRPTLLRLRSQDSGSSVTSDVAVAGQVDQHQHHDGGYPGNGAKRPSKTLPNTPDLSHGSARRQAKTPDMSLDERRQKHVSFDSAALLRSQPSLATMADGDASDATRRQLQSALYSPPPMRRLTSSKVSPDRKSQERLLDIGSGSKRSAEAATSASHIGRRFGSVRSLDLVHPSHLMQKLRKTAMKTQATQTELNVAERVVLPAPVLAYLTLSPRAHPQPSDAVAAAPATQQQEPAPQIGRVFHNGKKLVKSRSAAEYRLGADETAAAEPRMTVVHVSDEVAAASLLAKNKRHAGRSRSSPIARQAAPRSQREIMVMFKPQERKSGGTGNGASRYGPHHHKLVKTFSEGSVLNRQQRLTAFADGEETVNGTSGGNDTDGDVFSGADNDGGVEPTETLMRERSESDPLLLETDMDDATGVARLEEEEEARIINGGAATRQRSRSVVQMPVEHHHLKQRSPSPPVHPSQMSSPDDEDFDRRFKHPVTMQHQQQQHRKSEESPSQRSDGSQYHSLTDHSVSSKSSSLGILEHGVSHVTSTVRPEMVGAHRKQHHRSGSGGTAHHHERLQKRSSDGTDSDTTGRLSLEDAGPRTGGSTGDMDRSAAYSSDTEFGSIRSDEDSHTLVDTEDDVLAAPPAVAVIERRSRASSDVSRTSTADLCYGMPGSSDTVRRSRPTSIQSHKEMLTSPESESRSFVSALMPGVRSGLSHTDSNRSELEAGSETSEDYQTATEHSNTETFDIWAGRKKGGATAATAVPREVMVAPYAVADGAARPAPQRNSSITSSTFLDDPCTPDGADTNSRDGTDEASLVTQIFAAASTATYQPPPLLHHFPNLPSPRSPHASSLSIASSTSGSYTLESNGASDSDSTRKLSFGGVAAGGVSDSSDKELENIFGRPEAEPQLSADRRRLDGVRAPTARRSWSREGADDDDSPDEEDDEEEEEDERSLTPTPDGAAVVVQARRFVKKEKRKTQRRSDPGVETEDSARRLGSSEHVIESSYNFAEIRQRFERMFDRTPPTDSCSGGRDRSSSMDTEGTISASSNVSEGGRHSRAKPEILSAKPVLRPSGVGKLPDRYVSKSSRSEGRDRSGSGTSYSMSGSSEGGFGAAGDGGGQRGVGAAVAREGGNGHRREYRRSISESPESAAHGPQHEMSRSISEAQFIVGGVRSKREFHHDVIADTSAPSKSGKKHKSRSAEKSVEPVQTRGRSRTESSIVMPPEVDDDRRHPPSSSSSKFTKDGGQYRNGEARRPAGSSYSFDASDVAARERLTQQQQQQGRPPPSGAVAVAVGRKRRERSLPGSREKLLDDDDAGTIVGERSEVLSKSLPDHQMELFEMSKMLCSECGEKVRRIHAADHQPELVRLGFCACPGKDSLGRDYTNQEGVQGIPWPHASLEPSLDSRMPGPTGARPKEAGQVPIPHFHLDPVPRHRPTSATADPGHAHVPYDPAAEAMLGGAGGLTGGPVPVKSGSGQSSTESLLQNRSPGGPSSAVADSPGPSSSQTSSWPEASQYASSYDVTHEEEDEDVGVYAESYRASAWIYIGENEELMVWKGRPDSSTSIGEEAKSEDELSTKVSDASSVTSSCSPSSQLGTAVGNAAVVAAAESALHRTDSLESTASEKEFRRRYQAITHRMVHRKSSVEMYKRLSNRTFECDKTVMVQRKGGEFGFRIHGSRPVVVSAIESGTPAETSGLEVGDIVIAINGVNVLDASHSEVVKIAHTGSASLRLDVARTCHTLTPVVSNADLQRPLHSGYLYKQVAAGPTLMRKWCRRWFVLKQDHCLYYYKTETSKEPLGAIVLLNYSVNRANDVGRPFTFRVTKYGSASYCFAAEDEDSMNCWASLMNQSASLAGQYDPWIEVSSRNVQLPALSIYNPDCHGYLTKLGQRWKTWKRRYCVLKDACIYLYHDMSSTTSLGVAHLHGYRVQSCSTAGKKFAFEAAPPELKMRHFFFYADNDTDRKRWLAALEYSIDRWIKVG